MTLIPMLVAVALSQGHPGMPPGMSHEEHLKQMAREAEIKRRGDAAMGFDQDKTTHRFLIDKDGGTIQVTVKRKQDRENLDAIRAHLRQIAADFAAGRFDAPLATHGEVPPGVPAMQQRQGLITYRYEEIAGGARIRITTLDAEALTAVHEFLRFQIREHKTGDPQVR